MEEEKLEMLREIHDHLEGACSLALAGFDFEEKDAIKQKTGIDLDEVLRPVEQSLLKVLALYDLSTHRELREVERLYNIGASPEQIDEYELDVDKAILARKTINPSENP